MTLPLAVTLWVGLSLIGRPSDIAAQDDVDRPLGASVAVLSDGRWLVVGGEEGGQALGRATLFDPTTAASDALPRGLRRARAWSAVTVLPDGDVLVSGGVGANGALVRRAERFDASTRRFRSLATKLTPRAHHTATVLTDGRVLLVGGVGPTASPVASGELWDPDTRTAVPSASLATARADHTATLLADGRVLVWGGVGADGAALDWGEIYDPMTGRFQRVDMPTTGAESPSIATTIPPNGARDVALDVRLAVRFSSAVIAGSANTDTIRLSGPTGSVPVRVVVAERGRLVFVSPLAPLAAKASYTLSLSEIASASGDIPSIDVSFTTRDEPAASGSSPSRRGGSVSDTSTGTDESAEDVGAEPGRSTVAAHRRHRKKHDKAPRWTIPPLQAAPGVTALAGQLLRVNGKPLAGVLLQVDDHVTKSDATGRFLLSGLECSRCVLVVDGRPASRPGRTYGVFEFGQEMIAGETNVVMGPLWMPKIDTQHAVDIPSPTPHEIVVRTPKIPGLELHLPPNAVIRDKDGNVVHRISITPFPKDRPIMAPPEGLQFPVFFTIQPGGAHVETPDGTGAWLVYPNPTHLRAKKRVPFFSYDPWVKDWFIYGLGRVSDDGRRIVPEPGTTFTEFHCTPYTQDPEPPPDQCSEDPIEPVLACTPNERVGTAQPAPPDAVIGDPVDPSTGIFLHTQTDLMIQDVIPIAVTREYQSQDPDKHQFGSGMTYGYGMHLFSAHDFTEMDLVLPNRAPIHYDRISRGDSYWDAVYEHTGSPTRKFFKSRIKWNGRGWDLTLHNGNVYVFGVNYALRAIRDRFGATVTITRDPNSGRIIRVTSPSGRYIDFSYNGQGFISRLTDNIGRIVAYGYNGDYLQTVTDADNKITTYSWGQASPSGRLRLVKIINKRNIQQLKNTYNTTTGRILQQEQADSGLWAFDYTVSNGIVTSTKVTDPRNFVRKLTFNDKGYVTSDTHALNKPEEQTVSYTRAASTHLVQTVTDDLGRVTRFGYDANGNTTSITRMDGTPEALTTLMDYGAYNSLHTVTNPLGNVLTYNLDTLGRVASSVDPDGVTTAYTYNGPFGQVSTAQDGYGETTTHSYQLGNPVGDQDPSGRSVRRDFDRVGRLLSFRDARGYATSYTYDVLDRAKTRTDPFNGVAQYDYDENGNQLTARDPLNNPTTFEYGNMDRMIKRTDALGRFEQFTYDFNGNLTLYRDGGNVKTEFQYDALNRLSFIGYNQVISGATTTYDSTVSYTYDGANRLTQIVDSSFGTIKRTYDDFDRLTSEASCPTGTGPPCPNRTISYTYDDGGRRDTMTVPNHGTIQYVYYPSNRLKTILPPTGGSLLFEYDKVGRKKHTLYLPGSIDITYGYDVNSRINSIVYKASSVTLGDLAYTYDESGNPFTVTGAWARIGVPAGVASSVHDVANEITNWNGTTILHNAQGTLKGDGTWTWTWNERTQLKQASSVAGSINMFYDPFGRRWQKQDLTATTRYLYDGVMPVQETDTNGNVTANFITGPGDEIIRRTDGATTAYLLHDALNSTVALVSTAGSITTQYTYDPYGGTSVQNLIGTSPNRYQYVGRENDNDGLYYNRARYHHPRFGRFISPDPLSYLPRTPSSENPYIYAANTPTRYVDPIGLDPKAQSSELLTDDSRTPWGAYAIGGWTAEVPPAISPGWQAAGEFVGLGGFTDDGMSFSAILAGGAHFGLEENNAGWMSGYEYTASYSFANGWAFDKQPIYIAEGHIGYEIPDVAGIGAGAGYFKTGDGDDGMFGAIDGGALGEHAFVGGAVTGQLKDDLLHALGW